MDRDDRKMPAGWVTLVVLSLVTGLSYLVAQVLDAPIYHWLGLREDTIPARIIEFAVIALVSALVMWPVVLRPLRNRTADREAELREDRNTQEFHAQLHRAVEMANVEDAAHTVARRAMEALVPENTAELMLADSSEAHLKPVLHQQEQLMISVAAGTMPPFTVTFGIAQSDDASSLEELIRLADVALFTGKREGRNRIVSHSASPPVVATAPATASE